MGLATIGLLSRGLGSLRESFRRAPDRMRPEMVKRMRRIVLLVQGEAQKRVLGSRKTNPSKQLGVVTGKLRSSIKGRVDIQAGNVVGVVGPQRVVYARIHEFGGTIVPRHKPFLVFKGSDGGLVFTKRVRIPARPYMGPALKASQKRIEEMLEGAVVAAVE